MQLWHHVQVMLVDREWKVHRAVTLLKRLDMIALAVEGVLQGDMYVYIDIMTVSAALALASPLTSRHAQVSRDLQFQ